VPLVDLTHAHGVQLTAAMQRAGLRPTTIHKRLGHARAMLEDAERLGHVTTNPWRHVRHSSGDPSERRTYVPVAAVQRVIEAAPNVWWRLLIALARHAGCRIPSEAFSLTWGDVDWSRSRIVIRSPKGERSGKGLRTIPLFPCLRPILEEALEAADPDEIHVFPAHFRHRAGGPMGFDGANLRTTLAQIVRRAGLEPWPRIWHALRASLESDLAHSFALATVTKWLGNTPSVALRHYVDPTDQAFEAAILWRPPDGDVNSTSAVPKMPRDGNPTQSVATDYERIKDPEKTDKSNDRNPSQCEAINTPSRKRTAPERPRASSFATRTATASVAPTKRA
jgi:integrase